MLFWKCLLLLILNAYLIDLHLLSLMIVQVESIHQYIESMRTAYLADQRRRGEENDPFLEADRRETAKQEAAARRVHPTIHLPAVPQPTGQATGHLSLPAATGASTSTNTSSSATVSALSGSGLFSTPAAASSTPSLFSTPTSSAPFPSLLGPAAPSQSSPFSSLSASSSAFHISTPMFSSTPASGASTFSTPFATGELSGLNKLKEFYKNQNGRKKTRPFCFLHFVFKY